MDHQHRKATDEDLDGLWDRMTEGDWSLDADELEGTGRMEEMEMSSEDIVTQLHVLNLGAVTPKGVTRFVGVIAKFPDTCTACVEPHPRQAHFILPPAAARALWQALGKLSIVTGGGE